MNVEEMNLTLKDIEANPENHNPAWWAKRTACGTAKCAAGFTVVRHGYTLAFQGDTAAWCIGPDGEEELIAVVARRILDLDEDQAEWFFLGFNTLEDLFAIRDQLIAEEPRIST